MKKYQKFLIAIPLVLVALFVSACSDTKSEQSSSPQEVVDAFAEKNYTKENGIVAFESAVLKENDQEAVVVGVACSEVVGEDTIISSEDLVSILEKKGDEWTIVGSLDEIDSEDKDLPNSIASQVTQEEINTLSEEIKKDLPADCV